MLSFSSFAAEFASIHCKTFPYQNHCISHLSHVEQFGISPFLKLIRNFTLLSTPHATWKQYGGRNCLTSCYVSTNLFQAWDTGLYYIFSAGDWWLLSHFWDTEYVVQAYKLQIVWCSQYITQALKGLTYEVRKSFHDGVSVLLWRGDCMWSSSYKRLFWEKVLIIDLFCFSTESHSQKHREACRVMCDKTFTGLVSFAWPSFFGV